MGNDYSKMTDNQLEKEQQKLSGERAKIKAEMKLISEEQDRRATKKRLAGMSEKEKDNLRQAIEADSIESDESVGEPKV